MKRGSIAIIVVARRRPAQVKSIVSKLGSTASDEVFVANLSGEALTVNGATVIEVETGASLSEAVTRCVTESKSETVWILRDDSLPRPGALDALRTVLDSSPSVGVCGPKQMFADAPAVIREFGESMSATGTSYPLAENEFDQSQFDRLTDVLAVGEAGMLTRREVWEKLGGFDESLKAMDGALDYCYRARSAGWLIEAVPAAVIDSAESSVTAFSGEVSEGRIESLRAYSRAHRMLTYAPGLAVPFLALAFAGIALLRFAVRFISKSSHPLAEWSGVTRGILSTAGLIQSRRSFRKARIGTVDGSRLFITAAEVRRRRQLEREHRLALTEANEPIPRLRFGVSAFWWTIGFLLLGFVLTAPLFGATALSGGGIAPLPTNLAQIWDGIGGVRSNLAGGMTVAPDGFLALLGLLSSITWWNPNAWVVSLFVLAIPLSYLSGYIGTGAFTTKTKSALFVGIAWALLPTLYFGMAEGRITAVIAHILFPYFALAVMQKGIVSLGWSALLAAILWASVPALSPVIVLAFLVRAVTGRPVVILALAPVLALEWPRLLETLANPIQYLADRGVPFAPSAQNPIDELTLIPGKLQLPFLDSGITGLIALGVVAAIAFLGLSGFIVSKNLALGLSGIVGGAALAVSSAIGGVPVATNGGETVSIFLGPLFDVAWFVLLIGAAIALNSARAIGGVLAPVVLVAVGALSAFPAISIIGNQSNVHASLVRSLPAYIEAETGGNPGDGTLVISQTETGIIAGIERGSGTKLTDYAGTVTTRTTLAPNEQAIAGLAANLTADSGFDVMNAAKGLGVRFILLKAEETNSLVSVISSHPGITEVGETEYGVLWLVADAEHVSDANSSHDDGYRLLLLIVFGVALIAAVPTSLPRRRARLGDEVIDLSGEDEDVRY